MITKDITHLKIILSQYLKRNGWNTTFVSYDLKDDAGKLDDIYQLIMYVEYIRSIKSKLTVCKKPLLNLDKL